MVAYLTILLVQLCKLLAIALGAVYAGMVLMRYRTDRPHFRLNFQLRDPARSMQHLMVWLGVKILDACLRLVMAFLNMLLEASAEVGEWILRRSPTVQQSVRSRFLV